MKRTFDLSELDWQVAGYIPYVWQREKSMELGLAPKADISPIPAAVPGSVQKALRDAGLLPDWNVGLNARLCDWVENRHWVYQVSLPDDWLQEGETFRLRCLGLDFRGVFRLNGEEIATFRGTHIPHVVDLTPHLAASGNVLQIVFECPPRWLGTPGRTSEIKEWKPRFNYTWDWIPRLVQVGIWEAVLLEVVAADEIEQLRTRTGADPDSGLGRVELSADIRGGDGCTVHVEFADGDAVIRAENLLASRLAADGLAWDDLPIELWWPNGQGPQKLYDLRVVLHGADGEPIDRVERRVGFKHVAWRQCQDAPEGADPWICVVNGRPVFLCGVNWSPIRPNFADVPVGEYRKRIELYRDLNMNTFRVNGCAFLEKECFHDLCDELGLLVWQDFPLSSSGPDNSPPTDSESIDGMAEIVTSAILRRQHHASLLLWCGGNELQTGMDGGPGTGKPLGLEHPMLARMNEIVAELDPGRRFLSTSASGPRFTAEVGDFGKGLHWDVHGPWRVEGDPATWRQRYWQGDDALFRSEVGAPSPSSAELTRRFQGDCDEVPGTVDNPLWRRTDWWIEWPVFVEQTGRQPRDLEEYVAWGQHRQAEALRIAAESCMQRFPGCGGILFWHGHDCFPCTANTAIIDFDGLPKPAARALGEVFAR